MAPLSTTMKVIFNSFEYLKALNYIFTFAYSVLQKNRLNISENQFMLKNWKSFLFFLFSFKRLTRRNLSRYELFSNKQSRTTTCVYCLCHAVSASANWTKAKSVCSCPLSVNAVCAVTHGTGKVHRANELKRKRKHESSLFLEISSLLIYPEKETWTLCI